MMILFKKILGQSICAWIFQVLSVLTLIVYKIQIVKLSLNQMFLVLTVCIVLYIISLFIESKVKEKYK